MLDKLPVSLKNPLKWILLIGLAVYGTLFAVASFGNMGADFLSVIASLILISVNLIAIASVPVLLLLKKENLAKIIFLIIAGFWIVNTARVGIAAAYNVEVNNQEPEVALFNAAHILAFVYGLILLSAIVFIVLGYFLKNPLFKFIAFVAMVSGALFALVVGILYLVMYGQNQMPWSNFMIAINDYFILPGVICSGCLYFYLASK